MNGTSGALTLVGAGTCEVTITAADHGNSNEATATFTVTVANAGTLSLSVNTIATDNTVNIAEKAAGFTIAGDTGSENSVSVTVPVGTGLLSATSGAGLVGRRAGAGERHHGDERDGDGERVDRPGSRRRAS